MSASQEGNCQHTYAGEKSVLVPLGDVAVRFDERTWFWSRSRQELWNKGATSGNVQQVKRVLVDCDADTLLVEVDSPGPACHTGHRSCFFRELSPAEGAAESDR